MKKALLLVASALMSAVSFAQSFTATWEKPTVTNFVEMADDGETTQYLYNVGAKGFLAGHNDWNTRASVAEYGDSIRMKALEDGAYNLCCYPAAYTNKNKWLYVSASSWNAQWVDAGNNVSNTDYPGTSNWAVEKQANGSYKLTNTGVGEDGTKDADDKIVNPSTLTPGAWGVCAAAVGEENNTRCYFYNAEYKYVPEVDGEKMDPELAFPAGAPFWDEWQFVSVAEYEAYKEKAAIYLAAENLKAQIESAMEKGIEASALADEFEVYNNTSSSIEELKKAADAAYDKGRWVEIAEYFGKIVEGEKNDVSGVFTNPDFETGNVNGWDITYTANSTAATNIGYQHRDGGYNNGDISIVNFIEAWKANPDHLGDGSITQTIPGLPAGKYTLAVDAIANAQWLGGAHPDNVQLFAQASLDGKEYYTAVATDNEKPEHFEFTFIHTGGSMTLGLRVINSAEAQTPVNWIAMDNLQLFYYGAVTDDPDKVLLDDAIAAMKEKQDPDADAMEEVIAYTGDKKAYVEAIESAEEISANGGDYMAAQDAMNAAYEQLQKSIKAYETFKAFNEKVVEQMDNFSGTKFEGISDELGDNIQEWEEAYEEQTYTIEQIDELDGIMSKMVNDYVSQYLEAGDDITFMIQNPDFDTNFSGWQTDGARPAWGGLDQGENTLDVGIPAPTSGNAEVYHAKFAMFQTIKNMPAGIYQFSCQAFERDDSGKGIETFLYAVVNDEEQRSAVPNQHDYATEEKLYDQGSWPSDAEWEGKWVPNGMQGAYYHFAHTIEGNDAPDYTTKLNIILNEQTDLTFGIKCISDGDWVIFDNFKLTYLGGGVDVYLTIINEKLAELNAFVTANEDNVGTDVTDGLAALEAGVAALDTEEACKAYIAKIDEAIAYAKKSAELYPQAEDIVNQLETAKDEEEANPVIAAEASEYLETIADNLGNRELTVAELEAVIEKASSLMGELKVPANYAEASDENPVEMTQVITNPSFEDGLNGWTYYQGSDTRSAENSNGTYTVDIADGAYVFNTWNSSAPADGYYVSQVVKSLPAGTYELQAILASDKDKIIDLTANGEGMPFVMGPEKQNGNICNIIFKLEEKGDVTIKAFSMSWFKADDFRLTYYGNESDKEVTGIEETEIANTANGNAPMYNLAGQQVGKDYKGIVIVNGKKLYIK
ncbi:MAG: DUF5339 domain-containing protein [Bacteroidaceae bacterium]|nr:DUF5339 domain-containing protein [Bacteroidaceae bacterium]